MYDFNKQNKLKEARCIAENIDETREEEFKDQGNDSPLFRWEFSRRMLSFAETFSHPAIHCNN